MSGRIEHPVIGDDEISHQRLLEAMDDAVLVYRGDTIRYANKTARSVLGYERDELADVTASDCIHPGDRERLREYQRRRYDPDGNPPARFVARVLSDDNVVRRYEFNVQVVTFDSGPATLAVLRDVTEKSAEQTASKRENRALETLTDIYEELLGVSRALVRTLEHNAVGRIVCTRLAETDFYEFAWLHDTQTGQPLEVAGIDPETVESLYANAGPIGDEFGPAERAVRDSEVRIVDGIEPGDSQQGRIAAVPVGEDVIHCVLLLYTDRVNAFGVDERAALGVFGEIVGFILTAMEDRELLVSDAVMELAFGISDPDFLLGKVARTLDAELVLNGVAAYGSTEHWYVQVTGDRTLERTLAIDSVNDIRVIDAEDGRFKLVVDGDTVPGRVVRTGAIVTDGHANPRESEIVVCLHDNHPVSQVCDIVRDGYPNADLIHKRTLEEGFRSPRDFRGMLDEELTERRRAILQAAYHAGYFEWPRDTTGKTIAESLDITQPTFHNHLRNAERLVLEALFDPEEPADESVPDS